MDEEQEDWREGEGKLEQEKEGEGIEGGG